MARKYLLYISQNYSFEILRPLQAVIREQGDQCAWFVEGNKVNKSCFEVSEKQLNSIDAVISYAPDVVFVPGNLVPDFIPGLKVQVFHGLEWKKRSHFRIRGMFDLYCTHGPITTNRFKQLAQQHQHFEVIETGWCKLDPLLTTEPYAIQTTQPVILFAPTFSPNLTCAVECFDEIKRLISLNDHYWLIKFHPKMNPEWIALYQSIKASNYQIVTEGCFLSLLQRADILLSDTSSAISEFLLLNKPAITYNNADPDDYLINITSPNELNGAIKKALKPDKDLLHHIDFSNQQTHPYHDGRSSYRIIDAVNQLLDSDAYHQRKKPFNFLRKLKLRRKLKYWKF